MTAAGPGDRARRFASPLRERHRPGDPLILPNVWDLASARRVARAGFAVIATSSEAVAESLGLADREQMSAEEAFAVAQSIAADIELPLTVDAERGYGLRPAELVEAVLSAGASGINLQDTDHRSGRHVDVRDQSAMLAAVRAAAQAADFGLVINARIDTWFHLDGRDPDGDAVIGDAVQRAQAYLQAGADCVYPIGRLREATTAELVRLIPGPVNALWGSPDAGEVLRLAQLGVARVSAGPMLWRRAMERLDDELTALSGAVGPAGRTRAL